MAINRVAKVVQGGRRFSFTALVVVGDGDGTVGVGYGKAREVPAAIAKGVEEAKKAFFRVPRIQGTIPHPVQGEKAAGVVMLRPASRVPASSPAVAWPAPCSSAPVCTTCSPSRWARQRDQRGARHRCRAEEPEEPEQVAKRRGLPVADVAPAALLRAREEAKH